MTQSFYGLQRRGEWLSSELCQRPRFGVEPIWVAADLDTALEKAQLMRMVHGLTVEARKVPA